MDKNGEQIASILERFFPNPHIPLEHEDPYTLLIATLLSARCLDHRVNQITPHLFALAKTPSAMITLPVETIQAIIRPCGLSPQKSQAIWKLSLKLLEEFEGKVPPSIEAMETLPGVGHKTASVVAVQAFGIPAFPVDTHIHRSAKRWHLSSGRSVKQTEKDLKKQFPPEMWGKVHLQIILFARKFCPARGHIKENCPICSSL